MTKSLKVGIFLALWRNATISRSRRRISAIFCLSAPIIK